jgi:hypothetical protein
MAEQNNPMATRPSPARRTHHEFARLPEDGNRYEVIAGLCVKPAPGTRHQRFVTNLTFALEGHARAGQSPSHASLADHLAPTQSEFEAWKDPFRTTS